MTSASFDDLPATKSETLARRIEAAIERGLVTPGTRLHSIRECAARERVARNTVVEAYLRLAARGYVEPRPGSGFFVRKRGRTQVAEMAAHVSEAVDVVSLLREQLEQRHEVRVGEGRLPAAWMDESDLGKRLRGVRSGSAVSHGYGTPWGAPALRETIVRVLGERQIQADTRQVLLTMGVNHALDLIVRNMLEPGDVALVDAPGYYPLFAKLRLAKVEMVGVPRQFDGPSLDDLHRLAERHRPKVFFTQSLAHNPTGGSLSLPKAHGVLQAAARHGFLVVEDDALADLQPAAAPRLAALDQFDRVLYVSSYSKTLSAGLRVGFVAGSRERLAALCDLKMVTIASTSELVEHAVDELVNSARYRRHLGRLRARLQAAHRDARALFERAGMEVQDADPAGYYVWTTIPGGHSELEGVRDAAAHGIFIAPGSVFYPDKVSPRPTMRVNVAYIDDERFRAWLLAMARRG
jgi:DNA-binding transcriptional MocR family regulator